jgi:hypothetical protein
MDVQCSVIGLDCSLASGLVCRRILRLALYCTVVQRVGSSRAVVGSAGHGVINA